MAAIRRFWLAAWLSYRALFTWLNPWGYISTRIVLPITIALMFGAIGRQAGDSAVEPVVGASMLAVAFATIDGVNLAVANEREFGTLGAWLATPQRLVPSLLAKAVFHVLDALLGAALTLGTAVVVFSLRLPADAIPALAACALVAAASSCGLGLTVAGFSVRFRDVFTAPEIAEALLLVSSGAVVATASLPARLGLAGEVLPLTHAVRAVRAVVSGAPLPLGQLGAELLIGAVWGVFGYAFLRWMTAPARDSATIDLL
jgi:ABC-2 type transport system permease protein